MKASEFAQLMKNVLALPKSSQRSPLGEAQKAIGNGSNPKKKGKTK